MGAHLSTAGRREAARTRRAEKIDTVLRQAKRRISRPSRFGLPEDALLGVLAFADYPGVAYGSAVCREFRDALTKIKPDLLHSLALHRFPQLKHARTTERPDPRQLFESQRRLLAPRARPVPPVTPRRTLDSYVFSLELSTRRHGAEDQAKTVVHVGEGRVTRNEGKPELQFDVPGSVYMACMLDDAPLDIYASVLCFRRGTWQRCLLTQTEVDDCDGDTFYFDWVPVPHGRDDSQGRLLSWLRQNPDPNDEGTNVAAWPLVKLNWDRTGGAGPASRVHAAFMWDSVGDIVDMNEDQARMTLEAWCAWT